MGGEITSSFLNFKSALGANYAEYGNSLLSQEQKWREVQKPNDDVRNKKTSKLSIWESTVGAEWSVIEFSFSISDMTLILNKSAKKKPKQNKILVMMMN